MGLMRPPLADLSINLFTLWSTERSWMNEFPSCPWFKILPGLAQCSGEYLELQHLKMEARIGLGDDSVILVLALQAWGSWFDPQQSWGGRDRRLPGGSLCRQSSLIDDLQTSKCFCLKESRQCSWKGHLTLPSGLHTRVSTCAHTYNTLHVLPHQYPQTRT